MMLSICIFLPLDYASPGFCVSVVVFVAVELSFVPLFYSVLDLVYCFPLRELITSDSLSLLFSGLTIRTTVHLCSGQ